VGGVIEQQARPALIRSRREAVATVALYAGLGVALLALAVTLIVAGPEAVGVPMLASVMLWLAVLLQSVALFHARVRPPIYARRKAEAPEDGIGYVLAMLKPYRPSETFRSLPPGPLIAAIRFLRAGDTPRTASERSRDV
jgi:hypothetical protein